MNHSNFDRPLVWVIIFKTGPERLKRVRVAYARMLHDAEPDEVDEILAEAGEPFLQGIEGWSAAYTTDPSDQGAGERELALALSRELDGDTYLLNAYLDELDAVDHPSVEHFRRGKHVSEPNRDWFAVALDLGFDFPDAAAFSEEEIRAATIVEGASVRDVEARLRDEIDLAKITIIKTPLGAVAYAWEIVARLGKTLSGLFPNAAVHEVSTTAAADYIWYRRFGNGDELGSFMFPSDPYEQEGDGEDPYILYKDVLGETEPLPILRKLGVAELLGFK